MVPWIKKAIWVEIIWKRFRDTARWIFRAFFERGYHWCFWPAEKQSCTSKCLRTALYVICKKNLTAQKKYQYLPNLIYLRSHMPLFRPNNPVLTEWHFLTFAFFSCCCRKFVDDLANVFELYFSVGDYKSSTEHCTNVRSLAVYSSYPHNSCEMVGHFCFYLHKT